MHIFYPIYFEVIVILYFPYKITKYIGLNTYLVTMLKGSYRSPSVRKKDGSAVLS